MKKIFKTITILMMFVVLCPVLVNAKEYTISTTDIKVDIDDSTWKVFTRDNIKDNKSQFSFKHGSILFQLFNES